MSYDLVIRSDDQYSQSRPIDEVARVVSAIADVTPNGPDSFMIDRTEAGVWISMDISFAGPDGDRADPPPHERNVIDIHVPAAFFDGSKQRLMDVAASIADRLGWRVYDPQEGVYISR
jgi:hypothetical protein